MTMLKHTPAPWRAMITSLYLNVTTHDYAPICQIMFPTEAINIREKITPYQQLGDENQANAHLIVAAPEMFDLLRKITELDQLNPNEAYQKEIYDEAKKLIKRIQKDK